MPTINKKLLTTTTTINIGCSCRTLKLSKIFHPKPYKHKPYNNHSNHNNHSSPTTSWTTTPSTTTTFSPDTTTDDYYYYSETRTSRAVLGFGKIGGNSLAVEKDSDDPYVDFRESMLQMIMEKEIYSRDDLKELLNCFLQLNSPYYHGIIIRVFTDIWKCCVSNSCMGIKVETN